MSKPVRLNNRMRRSLSQKVDEILRSWTYASEVTDIKLDLGEMGLSKKRTTLWFTPLAYFKMEALVNHFDSEVAWNGVVDRADGGFVISDILVHPQEVSGAKVDTDQKEYEKWLMSFEDEVFNRIRMQGHSHVSFATNPSGTDTAHQTSIIRQLDGNDYYIFLIVNKKHSCYVRIVDNAENVEYGIEDVDIKILDDAFDFKQFIDDADKLVKPKTYSTYSYPSYPSSGRSCVSPYPATSSEKYVPSHVSPSTKPVGTYIKSEAKPKDGYQGSGRYWRDLIGEFIDE